MIYIPYKSVARKKNVCGIINGRILELRVAMVTGGNDTWCTLTTITCSRGAEQQTEESNNDRINWSLFGFERGKRPAFTVIHRGDYSITRD